MVAQHKVEQQPAPSAPTPVFEAWSEPGDIAGNPVHRLQKELAGGLNRSPARAGFRLSALFTVPLAAVSFCIVAPLALFPVLFDSRKRAPTRTILSTLLSASREAMPALVRR
jgi:hypothetical protein